MVREASLHRKIQKKKYYTNKEKIYKFYIAVNVCIHPLPCSPTEPINGDVIMGNCLSSRYTSFS